jgi:ATP-dependent DNA helicase RecG
LGDLTQIQKNPKINRTQMAKELGNISEDGVKSYLAKLTREKIIKHVGSTKSGYWIIIKNKV